MKLREAVASQGELAELLGVSQQAVAKWRLPPVAGGYRLRDAVERRTGGLLEQLAQNTETLTAARIRLTVAQSDKVEMETQTLRGRLIPESVVERVWCDIGERMKSKLLVVPSKVGLVLAASDDVLECEEHVRRAMHDALAEIVNFNIDDYLQRLLADTEEEVKGETEKAAPKPVKRSKAAKRAKRK